MWKRWRCRDSRLVPAPGLVAATAVYALLVLVLHNLVPIWLWTAFGALAILTVVWDSQRVRRLQVEATRQVDQRLQLGVKAEVQIRLYGVTTAVVRVDAGLPETLLEMEPMRWQQTDQATLAIEPVRRGVSRLGPIDVALNSPWRLWQRFVRFPESDEILVLPDLTSWREPVLAVERALSHEGAHVKRLTVGDTDFSYISEYTPDDDPRRINWAATARRHRLMKNVFEADRGQQVILAIDASRYMRVELDNGQTRLDYALACAAALAHAALNAGDAVGVVVFADRILSTLPPRRGLAHWRRVVEELSRVEAVPEQGGYEPLFRGMTGAFLRRSFIIVLSDLEGMAADRDFSQVVIRFRRKHPVMFVSVRDTQTDQVLSTLPSNPVRFAGFAAAHWLTQERAELVNRLKRQGIAVVQSPPGDLVVDAVAAHLQRRRRIGL